MWAIVSGLLSFSYKLVVLGDFLSFANQTSQLPTSGISLRVLWLVFLFEMGS